MKSFALGKLCCILAGALACSAQAVPPHLNGAHFQVTALQEPGFLDISDNDDGTLSYSGYLIDMMKAISQPHRANFTYTLQPPSGYGSLCVPRIQDDGDSTQGNNPYDPMYRTQYNCGATDINDLPLREATSTDMYLGMYYVTPSRLLENQFSIPFNPPFGGTLAMFGTATGVPSFEALAEQQQAGLQPAACAPGGTALLNFVTESFPGLQIKGLFGGEQEILDAFRDGTCQIYINDGPIAAHFVLRRSRNDECTANGLPIGVIGDPMPFGLSHYAIGIRRDIPSEVTKTISYWLDVLMQCNPLDPDGGCPEGNLATFYQGRGGTGDECGYVLFPQSPNTLSPGAIGGIVVVSITMIVVLYTMWHWYRLARQKRKFMKKTKATMAIAKRERDLNEFIAHEVRNPLSSAIAALNFVSSKASNPELIESAETRALINSDINVVDTSLQFINDLLRNMLDLHRTNDKAMKLYLAPTDILRDVFEPVVSILFMRGAKVKVIADCPPNVTVMADRMRLKQICLNLASNSSKFVEQGFIRLRAEVIEDNVHIRIQDSGPGVPAEKRNQLFAKFQESLDVLNQGTGLGLCVCKNLSELMEADLFLEDDYNSGVDGCPGASFTLRLNQAPLEIEKGLSSLESEEIANSSLRDLPIGISVLFTDDDTVIRKMFSRTLRNVAPTWRIEEASNGETALRFVQDEKFDLIFMDHYMASHTKQLLGTETIQVMRSKGVSSIICGLSANDKEEEFLESGADAFMLKPFPCQKDALKSELLRLLNSTVDNEPMNPLEKGIGSS